MGNAFMCNILKNKIFLSALFCGLMLINPNTWAEIRLGVTAIRGELQTLKRWEALGTYLTEEIKQPVKIIALTNDSLIETAAQDNVDFVLITPVGMVLLMEKHQYIPLATLNTLSGTQFAGVIVSKKGSGIKISEDLKGKKVISMQQSTSAGAYLFQTYHLKMQGIDPHKDFASFKQGKNQDDLIMGVKIGLFDAAFVRSGILESLEKAGKIKIEDFEIVDQREDAGFPHLHTTILYPEFCLSAKPSLDPQLILAMKQAVLKLNSDHHAAKTAEIKGFVEPISYEPIKILLQTLKIEPFN
jgi:ABC-type phosphate/phosphonate transport system substrate-binding protein